MKDLGQSASGDDSRLYQAGRDVVQTNVYNLGMDRDGVMEIAEEVMEKRLPALASEALAVYQQHTEQLTTDIVERLIAEDPRYLERFREVRVQIALGTAQQGYGQSGDNDLRQILANLVVEAIQADARTHRDLVLRQSIDCAPKLTISQLNGLAVISLIRRTCFPNVDDVDNLIESLDNMYKPYYEAIPATSEEYSYMASIGCGTESQLTVEAFGGPQTTPYLAFYRIHLNAMYKGFYIDELPPDLQIGTIGEFVVPESAKFSDRYIVKKDLVREISDSNGITRNKTLPGKLVDFISARMISEEDFADKIRADFPDLASFMDQLSASRALDFAPNAVGRILGFQTAICHAPTWREIYERLLLYQSDRA